MGKFRNLEHEVDGLKQNMDEETGAKENAHNSLYVQSPQLKK